MGLFSGDEFEFKNIVTAPWDIAKANLSFVNDFRKDPKGAFGRHQDKMTDTLAGLGFDRDNALVKNSDAVAAAVVGSIFAAPAMGAGAAAGGGGAAGGGLAGAGSAGAGAGAVGTGTAVGGGTTGAGAGAGAGGGLMGSLQSGSWLQNPYTQVGMGLLQQQNQSPQMQMQPMQMGRGAMYYNQGGLM